MTMIFSVFGKNKRGIRRFVGPKRVALGGLFVLLMIWAWDSYHEGLLRPEIVELYIKNNPVGAVLLYLALFSVSLMVCLPTMPLNLAAGFFWGGLLGGFYSALGATVGSWASFLAARFLFGQPLASKFDNEWAQMVQHEFDENGWKFVAFARINPIIPTGPLNYLLGLTSLSNRGFVFSTFFFLLPPAILVSSVGQISRSLVTQPGSQDNWLQYILLVSAIVTVLAAGRVGARIYRKGKARSNGPS